jgi:NAD(P)-dependent dehydrogenase (short-subunit alcohol dehydrogenase family)
MGQARRPYAPRRKSVLCARSSFRVPRPAICRPRMKHHDSESEPSDAVLALPAVSLTPADVQQCTRLLEAIVTDRSLLASIPKSDQVALLNAAGRVASPDRDAKARLAKAILRREKQERLVRDRGARAATEIRAVRQEPVFTAPAPRALSQMAQASLSSLSSPSSPSSAETQPEEPVRMLEVPRNCYVCKAEFRRLHFFYDALCYECAEFNYVKRFQTAPLTGKMALVTGGRVKIGFQASLMLLRAGASVIVTTRFPNDAARRYASEGDFASWSDRLHVHGLDLRHAPSVELFAQHIAREHDRLDILINNAAQTVRRPPGFYRHLLELESLPATALDPSARPLLASHTRCLSELHAAGHDSHALTLAPTWRSADPALGLHASAALSQVPYALETDDAPGFFPEGKLDADLQQVDLRRVNTWRLTLAEVQTAEMLEVHLVNAVAPFILCAKLKPLMLRNRSEPGHIVNVSAMEGSFSRGTKTDKHPHTNMAKAALNMMTLTSASDYAKGGIYMNAVDTGWVTDEDPAEHAERKRSELDFEPPLDIVDGAARICDPVFASIRARQFVFGKFYKDYRPTSW